MKVVTLENNRNEKINGILRNHNITQALIIICHGYASSYAHPALTAISTSLYERGRNVFSFNFSESAQTTALKNQVSDILSIISYFKEFKKFILMGGSFGALNASIATLESPKIKGLITVNGFFSTTHLGPNLLRIYLMFRSAALLPGIHKETWKYMKKMHQPERINVPVLVIHSQDDKDVSIKQSQLFYEHLTSPKTFRKLKHANHNLSDKKSIDEVVQTIDTWMTSLKY
ncbi:MAG TPA: alpha/beta fold hydrolase [Candidatus Saccharimonadales bacterium]|nr:alpha/beta fold hydrolase [Candidatus Saccharimonadales bacterium]